MNTNEQLHHVQPLIDQVAELIRTGQHPDASPKFKPEQPAMEYDPTIMDRIPRHFVHYAIEIENFFKVNGIKEWVLYGIQSRREPVEATAQPKAKTALGELAEWLDKVESHYPATGYMRQQLATWAKAVREADEQ